MWPLFCVCTCGILIKSQGRLTRRQAEYKIIPWPVFLSSHLLLPLYIFLLLLLLTCVCFSLLYSTQLSLSLSFSLGATPKNIASLSLPHTRCLSLLHSKPAPKLKAQNGKGFARLPTLPRLPLCLLPPSSWSGSAPSSASDFMCSVAPQLKFD